MRFLTPTQWQEWCLDHSVPLRESGWLRPDIRSEGFYTTEISYPRDSGKKVWLAQELFSLVNRGPETLILVDDWSVWPSCQHMPLFTRFREALGEHRPLIEVPGHLAQASDGDDSVSIITASILFLWDCYGISSTGRDAFYLSHDENCFFASRDSSRVDQVALELGTK